MAKWIESGAQLPAEDAVVIATGYVFNKKEYGIWVEPSWFVEGVFYAVKRNEDGDLSADFDLEMHPPTHWMPLPEPPK